jgi:hypothetical protein
MFQPKTLFVIGAGSSAEFNFPTGTALMNIIKEKLVYDEAISSLADKEIHRALLTHVNRTPATAAVIYGLSDYVDAARQINRAMPLSASIDTYMDDHRSDARIQLCGRLAIVKAIMEAENRSKYLITPERARLLPPGSMESIDFDKLNNSWFVRFFRILKGGGVAKENVATIFNNISIISFNYDRSLEYMLVGGLHSYYAIPEADAEGILEKLRILHPYGTVGPWHEGGDHLPFGQMAGAPDDLLKLASRIRTYTEFSAHAEEVKRMVSEASVIIFLGFGYVQENMRLLGLNEHARATRQIYGTAFSSSQADKVIIHGMLSKFLADGFRERPHPNPAVDVFGGTCAQLFNEYSLKMSG